MKLIYVLLQAALWMLPKGTPQDAMALEATPVGEGVICELKSPMQGWQFTVSGVNAPAGTYVEWDMRVVSDEAAPRTWLLEYRDGGKWKADDAITITRTRKTAKEVTTVNRTIRFSKPIKGKVELRLRAVGEGSGVPEFRRSDDVAACVKLQGTTAPKDTVKVLCIGNSFTYVSQAAWMLKDIAWSKGHYLDMHSALKGGQTFGQHLRLCESAKEIAEGGYEIAFFQNQSQTNAWYAQGGKEAEGILADCVELCGRVRSLSPDVKIFIEQTWSYPGKPGAHLNGDFTTEQEFDSLLAEGSAKMAAVTDSSVSPIGPAFNISRAERPDIAMFASDGKHQSSYGAYLKACVNYIMIFGQAPTDASDCFLDPEKAAYLRSAAARACGLEK